MSQSLSPLHQVSEALLQAASIGVTIADVRTNDMPLVYVNRGFEQMTGYMASEVIGKNCRFLQGAHTDQPALTNVREALSEGAEKPSQKRRGFFQSTAPLSQL
jgi:PAS domain S-box-containing protein